MREPGPEARPRAGLRAAGALLSGLLTGLAYHPTSTGSWPLGIVGLVPLLLVMRRADPRTALALGGLSGVTMTTVGFVWLPGALAAFGDLPIGAAMAASFPFWVWHAGRVAVFAILAVCSQRNGWHRWLAIVASFATSEALYPVVVPWYLAGAAHDAPILLQVADIGGAILGGIVVLSVNWVVAEMVSRLSSSGHSGEEWMVASLFLASALGYGAYRLLVSYEEGAAATRGSRVSVGMIQGNVDPLVKERDPAGAVRRQLLQSRRLVAERRPDVLIWSETSTGYSVSEHLLARWAKEVLAPHLAVPIVFGTGVIDDAGNAYNSAVSMLTNGELAGRYDKRRLFPIGEYAFAPSLFTDLARRAASFTEGNLRDPLTLHGRPAAVTICHEGLWPGLVREGVRAHDAELLVNLTNDIRFGDTSEPWAHFHMTKLRAIEHRRYLVRVANSGISAVVDPAGRVMAATRPFRAEAVAEDVFLMSGHTLYGRIGDVPWYAVSVACLYMALVRRRQPGESGRALAA